MGSSARIPLGPAARGLPGLAEAAPPPSGALRQEALANAASLLAALPSGVRSLLQIAAHADADVSMMACAVEQQPLLAAAVRRLAYAVMGSGGPTTSIVEAIAMLGAPTFAALAATAAAAGMLEGPSPATRVMERSILVAALCRSVSPIVGASSVDASLCGLFHDVGEAMLLRQKRGYADLVAAADSEEDRLDHERAYLGFDHAGLAASALRSWNVSERVCAAVQSHHDVEAASDCGARVAMLVSLVRFGDAVARRVIAEPHPTSGWIDKVTREESSAHLPVGRLTTAVLCATVRAACAPYLKPEEQEPDERENQAPLEAAHAGCVVCDAPPSGAHCPSCGGDLCLAHEDNLEQRWCGRCDATYRAGPRIVERVLLAAAFVASLGTIALLAAARIRHHAVLDRHGAAALLACALITVVAVCARTVGRAHFRSATRV